MGTTNRLPDGKSKELSYEEQVNAIKTWRYLRLAMVALVVGLLVSVGYERWKVNPGCFQTSISAYYYTPVHNYFVGALVSIGVCLYCLKGNKHEEDILLNLAGMFAPVVALVPTSGTGSCASVLTTTQDRDVNVANNVPALLAVGFLGVGILVYLGLRDRELPPRPALIGFGVAALIWIATALVFYLDRDLFRSAAHLTAAGLMFLCIILVVCFNARGFKEKTDARSPRNRYGVIAGAMIVSAVVIGIAGLLGWDYWLLLMEFALITLFAIFWVIQTIELWHDGLR
jgi:hypothetical protein